MKASCLFLAQRISCHLPRRLSQASSQMVKGQVSPRTAQRHGFCMVWVDNDQRGDVCVDSERGENNLGSTTLPVTNLDT